MSQVSQVVSSSLFIFRMLNKDLIQDGPLVLYTGHMRSLHSHLSSVKILTNMLFNSFLAALHEEYSRVTFET